MYKNNMKRTYSLVSLGCPKNLVDSERMAGLLRRDGFRLVDEPEGADFVLVNTCGFLKAARKESLDTIREMIRLKEQGKLRAVIVCGCLAERDRDTLLEECPGIDQMVGVFGRDEITQAANRLFGGDDEPRSLFRPAPSRPLPDDDRLRITPPHVAYLKIAEGCSRACTFCSIPSIRGPYASKPIEQAVREAEQLAAEGTRELILIAQDTTYYGIDTDGKPRLADLLARLDQVSGLEWIRLMYLYPMHVTEELIDVMVDSPRILSYLDLPLQHISDRILRRMNRRITRAETESLVERLRDRIPDLVLRTTMIAGFPGETDKEFNELLTFVRQFRFERMGAFAYSREPNTPAIRLDSQISEPVREQRRHRLLAAQQAIAFDWNDEQVGRRKEVLIDRDISGQNNAYVGRTQSDAPEIDGVVYVTGENLQPGMIVPCEIVTTKEYDLVGVAIGSPR